MKVRRLKGHESNYLEIDNKKIYCEEANLKIRIYKLIGFLDEISSSKVDAYQILEYIGGAYGTDDPRDEISIYG